MRDLYGDFIASTRARVGLGVNDRGVDDWLAGLSELIAELVDRWELTLGDPFDGGAIGYTVGATRAATDPVVLKITYPDGWFPEEVAALALWDGAGAVELIDHDPRGAMLLERALPGTDLLGHDDEDAAMLLAAGVMERLWEPTPTGISSVAEEVGRWASTFRDRNRELGEPVPCDLGDEAVSLMDELLASPREELLLHGDLHLGNLLAAEREPWLAIDPKPLVGDREFDVTALIRDKQDELVADVEASERLQHRFDLLAERLSCDRERLRAWSIVVMTDYALSCWEEGIEDLGPTQVTVAELLRGLRA